MPFSNKISVILSEFLLESSIKSDTMNESCTGSYLSGLGKVGEGEGVFDLDLSVPIA